MLLSNGLKNPAFEQWSDRKLALAASEGDESAYNELYARHQNRTLSLIIRLINGGNNFEDLNQEVWVQVFRKIHSFRGDSQFTTWLHRLTVNQVLMSFRKKSYKKEVLTEEGELPELPDHLEFGKEELNFEQKLLLQQISEQLPPGYYKTWYLHDVRGYEHEEVARIMGCSVGTSKSQLHKARLKLRKLANRQGNSLAAFNSGSSRNGTATKSNGHSNGKVSGNGTIPENKECPFPDCPFCKFRNSNEI